MMNLIRLLAILLLCTIFCPLYAEDSQTKRTIHVAQAGTLLNLISESEKYNIEELTLTGELNGTDFRLLRDMAGSNYLGEITEGKLTVLDLSNAKIVAGGEKYLDTNKISGNGGSRWSSTGFHFNILQDNELPQYVFSFCYLKTIILPNSITNIGECALESCRGLMSITIPNLVTNIGNNSFSGCSGLTIIVIPNSVTSIGYAAFSSCSGLTSIVIPNSVTSIGSSAFNYCNNLTIVVSEIEKLFEIAEDVFTNYQRATLIVPSGCKSTYKLTNCWNKFGQIIEASEIIPKRTFHVEQAGTLSNMIQEDEKYRIEELTLTGELNGTDFRLLRDMAGCNYLGERTPGMLTVLDLSNAKIVAGGEKYLDTDRIERNNTSSSTGSFYFNLSQDNEFPKYVFYACYLKTINLPNSITNIGESALGYCISLTSITIPNSVTSIGYIAFQSCIGLTSITIPNSVTSIGSSAFWYCAGLTSITIPNSVTSIGSYAFTGCQGLTSITVASNNPNYDSRDNCNAIIETKSNTLIAGCKNSTVPNSVTSIGSYTFFNCSGLTSLTIPNSVTSIGNYAFWCCSLTSITIPNSVNSIGSSAFFGCSGLTSLTIPNSVTSIGSDAFRNCTGLTSLTIPNSVTSIGSQMFYGCSGLTSITIPNSVTSIGSRAFYYCGLTSITIPNSVTSIESSAFSGCSGLISITVASDNQVYDSRNNCNAIIETKSNTLIAGCKNSVIPNSVNSIGSSAFYGCNGLMSITIPNSVTSIGDYAFAYCSSLTSVKSKIWNPFKIGANVFSGLPTDAELTIPNGTKSRYVAAEGWSVFSKITEEELADGVVFVGKIAVNKELAFMIISNNGKTCQVGDGIDCAITNWAEDKVAIPDVVNGYTVKAIGSNAFQNCSTLKSTTIPNTVTSIGDGAFAGCSGLTSIILRIENPFAINENVFPQEAYSATLYVPLGTKNQYLATAGWKKFKEIIEIATKNGVVFTDEVNGVTMSFKVTDVDNLKCQFGSGEESAISQSVTSFSVPSETKGLTVASIADNAIANCASLLSVTFPETIETVGSNVLAGCTNLAVIKWSAERAVPDALTSGVNNPNLLLYVKDKSYAPASVKNVVANGTADEIVLKETDGGNNFYCPEAFTAKRISFVHNYSMESGYKECRGWETIVLPFDVTSIMSETGSYVVPRSTWTNEDSQHKPFFLYEWTTAGWQPATAIKANIPYIICMPNNENYDPIYQLKGDFEFTGTNVQVYSTDEIGTVVYRNKRFVPNYLNREASQSMLPLNVNNLWDKNTKADYTEGSAFLRGLRAVRPFEAYMMMEEGMAVPMAIPVFGDGMPTGIDVLLVNSERVNNEIWYSLDGRKLQGKPTTKGVYILNGRKVVVK